MANIRNKFVAKTKDLITRFCVRLLHLSGQHKLLARLCSPYIKLIGADGQLCPAKHVPYHDRPGVLVLDADRFRADIELFAKHSEIQFFSISWGLLGRLLDVFVHQPYAPGRDTIHLRRIEFFQSRNGTKIGEERTGYREFLLKFLPHLYERYNIKVITSTDTRFRRQQDLGKVSSQLGVPFICYYREALYMVPALFELGVQRHKLMGKFDIDIVAVQNEITREMLLHSGCFNPGEIILRGCPRMDEFIRSVSSGIPIPQKKQLTVFSSTNSVFLIDGSRFYLTHLMSSTIRAVTKIALSRPDVRVVIKLKDLHIKEGAFERYRTAVLEVTNRVPCNMEFNTDRMAAQDVILNSTVVCALQSTVVLEAAIAGKPVILPHFDFILESPYSRDALMYLDDHRLFDVPKCEEDMEKIILKRLQSPNITPEVMVGRRELFETYVSPLDASSIERGIEIFKNLISKNHKNHYLANDH